MTCSHFERDEIKVKMAKTNNKVGDKKKKKEAELYSAAYDLFITKGINSTVIDDIVKKAGVAKGTFYLYFKDKYDILHKLILNKSNELIKKAVKETQEQKIEGFEDKVLYFIAYIIRFFKENTLMLKLINKNFSWGVYRKAIMKPEQYEEVQEAVNFFIEGLMERGVEREEANITLFMMIELISSVCYSSIVLEEPAGIDEVTPILYEKVLLLMNCR